jgi:predicted esterase
MIRTLIAGILLSGAVHAAVDETAVDTWFAQPPSERREIPAVWSALPLESKAAADLAATRVWQGYRDGARKLGWDQQLAPFPPTLEEITALPADQRPKLSPSKLEAGGKTMPYVLLAKGRKPANGWPLVIALHGGGGTGEKLEHPHAWPVNTREWQAQMALFERVYPGDALYFIPRMADDNDGRWYYDYCQEMYDQVIRRAILFRGVDPDRIYITGISEGGYTAFRLPGNQPGRFAAAAAMAAAEPMENAPPENFRNTPLRCDIGENDTMFDRIGLARRMFEKLGTLQKADPQGYVHHFEPQKGRGHGIDYAGGPEWMVKQVRDPRPKKLVWTVQALHHTVNLRNAWLSLDETPAALPVTITAAIEGNAVALIASDKAGKPVGGLKLRVYLDDRLLDLDQPVTVTFNGKQVHDGKIPRTWAALARSTAASGDPGSVFSAELLLK